MKKILALQFVCSLAFGAAKSIKTDENPLKELGLNFHVIKQLGDTTWYGLLSYSYIDPNTKEKRNTDAHAILRKTPKGKNKYTIIYVDENPTIEYVQDKPQKSTEKDMYPKMPKGLFRESTGLIIGPNGDRWDWSEAKQDWINFRTQESISKYKRYVHPSREVDQAFNSSKNRN